jgi:hypothetical protein
MIKDMFLVLPHPGPLPKEREKHSQPVWIISWLDLPDYLPKKI